MRENVFTNENLAAGANFLMTTGSEVSDGCIFDCVLLLTFCRKAAFSAVAGSMGMCDVPLSDPYA